MGIFRHQNTLKGMEKKFGAINTRYIHLFSLKLVTLKELLQAQR